jgi:hypothetical protein
MNLILFLLILSIVYSLKIQRLSRRKTQYFSLGVTSTIKKELTSDGGVIKEVISLGQGKNIDTGDILAIKYEAKIKNEVKPFAKSDKETCIVKDGSFIKGWDIGISSMKIGEKAKFQFTSKYAYGAKGVDPVIPPNSDIVVDLNVLAWLGNQLQPESLFQKDLDIDPFIASSPEQIQEEFDQGQVIKYAITQEVSFILIN